ncbi:MAG: hypothetical protein WAU28_03640 [Candidatus Moraniibacteriota bacterium]
MKKKISTAGAKQSISEDRALVMFEDIKDQFSAFGEMLSLIIERQEVLIEKVDTIEKRLIRIENTLISMIFRSSRSVL